MADPIHPEGVPLDVWMHEQKQSRDGGGIRRHIAARLIDTYSVPGSVVVDLVASDGEVLDASVALGRSAVFGPLAYACGRRATDSLVGKADLVVSLPPASHLAPPHGYALSVAMAESLARRAASLLAPGGFLVLASIGRGTGDSDPPTQAVAAATEVGLVYFQHVVMLLGDPTETSGSEHRLAHADLLVFARGQR